MRYFFLRSFMDYAHELIDRIGVDKFITISIFLWAFFAWNLIRKGTRL